MRSLQHSDLRRLATHGSKNSNVADDDDGHRDKKAKPDQTVVERQVSCGAGQVVE